jgi:hypothetical protein
MMDPFANINDQERDALNSVIREIQLIDSQTSAISRASSIKNSPGWGEYQKAIEGMLDRATTELVTTPKSNEFMRQQQGRVLALRDILAVMTRGESLVTQLAERRLALQNQLAELQRRMPRQTTEVAT